MIQISELDKIHYSLIRENVSNFIKSASKDVDREDFTILDVAPEVHKGVKEHFFKAKIKTLDIDKNSKADYIADLCECNKDIILDNTFDVIFCTEVLEHTNNPFLVVNELKRILKPGGKIYVSTPFNFRIHGPLPDNWRFTIHGLRQIFNQFNILEINSLESTDRNLMPIQYTLIAQKY